MITYQEALEFLHNAMKFGMKPGLERIVKILDMLGNPQSCCKFIHIGGTNGKGSTSAMTASVLQQAGYTTGLFISPYIQDFCERISINGDYIERHLLCDAVEKVHDIIGQMLTQGYDHPTEFEMITAIALDYFAKKRCDYVVLEVGLGGRLDSTNIIEHPIVSVITSISYDHMDILGDTLTQIATEKAGIIKENNNVVVYPVQQSEARAVLYDTARQKNCNVYIPDINKIRIKSQSLQGTEFIYGDLELYLPLIGCHQVLNCVTALEALRCVQKSGAIISDDDIKQGISRVTFSGRMEIVKRQPLILLDGAHNASGIQALCNVIDRYLQHRKLIVIMGMLKDKQYEQCIREVAKRASICYAVDVDNPRSLSAYEVSLIARQYAKTNIVTRSEAMQQALKICEEEDVILICGSLYLLGEFRQWLQN